LRNEKGDAVWLASDEMKKRAIRKEDVGAMLRQADIKGTAIVDVRVDPSGKVVCLKS
jgi:hypothetical protein